MTRNENDDTEALSSFYFDWIYECGQSFMQLKQKEKKNCAPDKCIFYCGTKRYCGYMDPLTYIGILDLMDNYKWEIKTRFCCRGHLLPTVKTNVYLYTDIDIFKTRHQLFFLYFFFLFVCFWDEEGMKRNKKGLWEALEILLGGHKRLWAHQNWAWEPKAGSKQL